MSAPAPSQPPAAAASLKIQVRKGKASVDEEKWDKVLARVIPETTPLPGLRKILGEHGVMKDKDVFLDGHKYPVGVEASTPLTEIIVKVDGANVIYIRQPEKAERKPLPEATLPESTELWQPQTGQQPAAIEGPSAVAPTSVLDYVKNATELTLADWISLINSTSLLHAISIHDSKSPTTSTFPAVSPDESLRSLRRIVRDNTFVEVEQTYSERNRDYISQHFTKDTASIQSPWASASAEVSHQEMRTTSSHHKTLYITGKYKFPRVKVEFEENALAPSAEFEKAVLDALGKENDEARRAALIKTFEMFGHVFATRVLLGGVLITTTSETVQSDSDEKKIQDQFKTKVTAKVSSISASFGHESSSSRTDKETDITQNNDLTFSIVGGNTLAGANIAAWIPTVGNFRNWRIIEYTRVVPTYKLFNAQIQSEVERLTPVQRAPGPVLRGRWVTADVFRRVKSNEGELLLYRPAVASLEPPATEGQAAGQFAFLGHTYKPAALVIQETGEWAAQSEEPALAKIQAFSKVWTDPVRDEDRQEYTLWNMVPSSPLEYQSLGAILFRKASGEGDVPAITGARTVGLRAVRHKYLAPAKLADKSYWYSEVHRPGGNVPLCSLWPILPADDTGLDLGLFFVAPGLDRPDVAVYTLRKEAVYIEISKP